MELIITVLGSKVPRPAMGNVWRWRIKPCDKSKVYGSNDVLLVRTSSLRPKAGTWYLKRSKKLLFSSSSSHVECNSFSTRLQQRKPGAGSSRRYFCAFWLRKRSERYRSWTSEAKLHKKVLLSLPTTLVFFVFLSHSYISHVAAQKPSKSPSGYTK